MDNNNYAIEVKDLKIRYRSLNKISIKKSPKYLKRYVVSALM